MQKIVNLNTVNVSYNCMENIKSVILKHNFRVLTKKKVTNPQRVNAVSCKNKNKCPLKGNCMATCIVYKANLTTADRNLNRDTTTIRNLSETRNIQIMRLNFLNTFLAVKKKHKTIHNQLVKLQLIKAEKPNLLNKRTEMISKCRHENKFYTKNLSCLKIKLTSHARPAIPRI